MNGIENLTRLSSLYLGENKIRDVGALKELKNLNFLNLSYNKIKRISHSEIIGICLNEGFPHLNYIGLDHNDIDYADKITIKGIYDCSF